MKVYSIITCILLMTVLGFSQQIATYTTQIKLVEKHVYGSEQLGIDYTHNLQLDTFQATQNADGTLNPISSAGTTIEAVDAIPEQEIATAIAPKTLFKTEKQYAISNHLGNVLTTINDLKLKDDLAGAYIASVESANDYYPFGMEMFGRGITGDYRIGYNESEKDGEIKGKNKSYTTYYRQYNPRVGTWLSIDPKMNNYPWQSPYNSMNGNPVKNNDPLGDEVEYASKRDKRQVFWARILSKSFRANYKELKDDRTTVYTFRQSGNNPNIYNANPDFNNWNILTKNGGPILNYEILYSKYRNNKDSNTHSGDAWQINFPKIKIYEHVFKLTNTKELGSKINLNSSGKAKFSKTRFKGFYDPDEFNLKYKFYSQPDRIRIYNQKHELLYNFKGKTKNKEWVTINPDNFNSTQHTTTKIKVVISTPFFYRNHQEKLKFNDSMWKVEGNSGGINYQTRTRNFRIFLPWPQKK